MLTLASRLHRQARMRRPVGVTLIALLHFLNAAVLALSALAIVAWPMPAVWLTLSKDAGQYWALYGLGLGVALAGGLGVAAFLAGWGLMGLRAWARWLTVVLALLAMPLFPVGSLLAVAVTVYLLQPALAEAFQDQPAPRAPLPAQ